jgi:hypothetical protein
VGCKVEKEWVGVVDAAKMLGVSPNTVRKMVADGKLVWERTSEPLGKVLIKVASIRALGGSLDAPEGASETTEDD